MHFDLNNYSLTASAIFLLFLFVPVVASANLDGPVVLEEALKILAASDLAASICAACFKAFLYFIGGFVDVESIESSIHFYSFDADLFVVVKSIKASLPPITSSIDISKLASLEHKLFKISYSK